MTKMEQIAKVVMTMTASIDSIEDKILARAIGTVIYDIPATRSGLISTALIDEWGYRPSITNCTQEHFHSRNESGYHIIAMARRGMTMDDLLSFLAEATTVHLTTKDENLRLAQIQNHPMTKDLTWQEQYALAGIELTEDPNTMPAKLRNKLKKEGKL